MAIYISWTNLVLIACVSNSESIGIMKDCRNYSQSSHPGLWPVFVYDSVQLPGGHPE